MFDTVSEGNVADRVMRAADALATFSEAADGLTCTYLSDAHCAVAKQLAQWMREAGFDDVAHDAVGNVIGRYRADPAIDSPPLVTCGSHYDTVRNGGRYDGRLGILLPIAAVAVLAARGERLPYDWEVVAFAEEEGVRYGSTFLGSSAYIGQFYTALLEIRDAEGIAMREAIAGAGLPLDELNRVSKDRRRLAHYFEVHIEQGPVLLNQDRPLGVVTAIAGGVRRMLTVTGRAGHAGTTPMRMRHDAACAAAEIVLAVQSRCADHLPVTDGLVGTVGQLQVPEGSINVIAATCGLSLDIRAARDEVRDQALADIDASIDAIAARYGVTVDRREVMRAPAVPCAAAFQSQWADALRGLGLEVESLTSGAGHDAMRMAAVAPVSMLFVRCGNGGISHHPDEIVSIDDVDLASQAVLRFVRRLTLARTN